MLYAPALTPELDRQRAAHRARLSRMRPTHRPVAILPPVEVAEPAEVEPDTPEYKPWFWIESEIIASRGYPTIALISRTVCKHYDVSLIDLISARREVKIVRPRQVAMYLAKTLTPSGMPKIGRYLGGRDHSTISHAFRKITRLIETDTELAATIAEITQSLGVDHATSPEDHADESISCGNETPLRAPRRSPARPCEAHGQAVQI